jgi:uncharacterized protein YndB with AHSA1/START domain
MSESMNPSSSEATPAALGNLHLEVAIEATPAKVWKALTEDLAAWWPAEFYTGGEDGHRTIALDAVPGGLMKETREDGAGLVWGTVMAIEPGRQLQVLGATFPNWGGPTVSFITWRVEEDGSGSRLTFEESNVGNVGAGQLAEKNKGWRFLLAAVKAHLTGEPAPAWEG